MSYYIDFTDFDTLEKTLLQRNANDLIILARLIGAKKVTRKADCAAAIAQHFKGDDLKRSWEALDDLEQKAVAEVVHSSNNHFDETSFIAKYGKAPKLYGQSFTYLQNVKRLSLLEIFFTIDVLPQDIKSRLREFVPKPAPTKVKTQEEIPEYITCPLPSWQNDNGGVSKKLPIKMVETESAAFHDLQAVLHLLENGDIRISEKTRRPSLKTVKTINAVLQDGDFVQSEHCGRAEDHIRAFAWPLLLQAAKMARPSGTKLQPTKAGREVLKNPLYEAFPTLWYRWVDNALIDEFSRIEAIKGQNRKRHGRLTDPVERREMVIKVLRSCPVGEWIAIDEFFRYFVAIGEKLEITTNPWNLYITDSMYGSLGYDGFHKWELLQGRYIMALLFEYAATLGLIDIAYTVPDFVRNDYCDNWGVEELTCLSRYDGLQFFRITPLGAYSMDMVADYTPAPVERRSVLRVLPNREIVIHDMAAFTALDALFLERFAKQVNENVWKFDTGKLLDAVENGLPEEDIHAFLETNSHTPVPDNVRTFITDTYQRAEMVTWEGSAELFKTIDEATALLIAHDTATKSFCYRAGDRRLVVPSRRVKAFCRALQKLGFSASPGNGIKVGR